MSYFVNSLLIRSWAETTTARTMLPHVIRQLVWATIQRQCIQRIDFPVYESGQRPGFDGEVLSTQGNAWVPTGHSIWELSVDGGSASKAGRDFQKRSDGTPAERRMETTYICVTARHMQKKKERELELREKGMWKDVRVFDADDIEQWMELAPGVAAWFASQMGAPREGVDDVASRWNAIATSTKKPLTPQVFLVSREETKKRIYDWLGGDPRELVVESRSPGEALDFFCAALQLMGEPEKEAFISRTVIIDSPQAWQYLRDNISPAILAVNPVVILSSEEVARAVARKHHVLIADEPRNSNAQMLERAGEFQLAQALETCGFAPVEAEQFARASGGSLAILKRRLGRIRTGNSAKWDTIASQAAIVSCLLLGGWEGANAADRAVVEAIAGRTYSELEGDFQHLATCREPLLLHAAQNWRLLSQDEAWDVLGNFVTPANLEKFRAAALEVLADDDPKFQLPDKDRIYAAIRGKAPKFSQTIKTHMSRTIAFLGAFGDKLEAASTIDISTTMDRIVREIVPPTSTWHRWASIGSRLTLLAEASPNSFLKAVREDLDRAEPELVKLLRDEGDILFGGCNHAGLLWALETLAWSKDFLPEVGRSLLLLVEKDPGGRWGNRPLASLCEILCDWMPHTMATVDERIRLLDMMIATRPETAWGILMKLLPEPTGGSSMSTHRPMWQAWANSWIRGATHNDRIKFIAAVSERIVVQAGNDPKRWTQMFKQLRRFPLMAHDAIVVAAHTFARSDLSDEARHPASEELSEEINRQRYFSESDWALPPEFVDSLALILGDLKPKSLVLKHVWLFKQWPDRYFGRSKDSYEDHARAIEESRDSAVREIMNSLGFDGIESLALQAEAPQVVGAVLARASEDKYIAEIIPCQISLSDKGLDLASGFVSARYYEVGWAWVDEAIGRCGTDNERAWLLVALPFESETWRRAEAAGGTARQLYWQRCRPWNHKLDGTALRIAVEALIEHHRPGDAIDLLATAVHEKKEIATTTLLLPLEAVLKLDGEAASQQLKRASAYDFAEVIGSIQDRDDVDIARLSRIEWNFLGLLDGHTSRAPKALHRGLRENPELFVEILSLCYRSKIGQDKFDDIPAEQRSRQATQGRRLLNEWNSLPGAKDDGSIDADVLQKWCDKVRRLSAECGRAEVCDNHLGQLFAHAPKDADGKWPCNSVRRIIESVATESIRSGLSCEIHNSRGTVWRGKGGGQERELAAKYKQQADQVRFESSFTAKILDDVSESYNREARMWDERDRWEA